MICVGIDPGSSSGCIVVVRNSGVEYLRLDGATEIDIHEFLYDVRESAVSSGVPMVCVLEKLQASWHAGGKPRPGSGMTTAWSLSGSYHELKMAIVCNGIQFDAVRPQQWQSYMGCKTGGDKRISQAKARQIYPDDPCYQWQADAMLLAEYGRIYVESTCY